MPCLFGSHNNTQVFLDVSILDVSSVSIVGNIFVNPPASTPITFRALVDSGATKTMISADVASKLNMVSIGRVAAQGVGSTITYHNGYLFHVAFLIPIVAPGQIIAPGTQIQATLHVFPTPIYGGEISSGRGFDVLLGMDVISCGSLKIEGSGTFSFSF